MKRLFILPWQLVVGCLCLSTALFARYTIIETHELDGRNYFRLHNHTEWVTEKGVNWEEGDEVDLYVGEKMTLSKGEETVVAQIVENSLEYLPTIAFFRTKKSWPSHQYVVKLSDGQEFRSRWQYGDPELHWWTGDHLIVREGAADDPYYKLNRELINVERMEVLHVKASE